MMTSETFHDLERFIQRKPFKPIETHPLRFGIERAQFECAQLERLIGAAKTIENQKIKNKVKRWKKRIVRLKAIQKRLSALQSQLGTAFRKNQTRRSSLFRSQVDLIH